MGRPGEVAKMRVFNCGPSKITPEDYEPPEGTRSIGEPGLPDKVDLRRPWWDIGNQGETGSCVGWAIADSLLRWHFIEAKRLDQNKHLSPRFIWMAAKEMDDETQEPTAFIEGAITKIKPGLRIAKNLGVVTEDVLPFQPTVMYVGNAFEFYEKAKNFTISTYKSLIGPEEGTLDSNRVCEWLAKKREMGGGPILVRMGADTKFVDAKKSSAVLETFDAWRAAGSEDHCAAIVGYYKEGGKTYFILRNSYGPEWGDEGYAYLSVEYLEGAVQEAWRVRVEPQVF